MHYAGHDGRKLGEEVVMEAFLAARCDAFLGNGASNVSTAIRHLKDWAPGRLRADRRGLPDPAQPDAAPLVRCGHDSHRTQSPRSSSTGCSSRSGRSGIARVWQSLLGLWSGTPFGDRLVVMDRRNRTIPRLPGIRYVDAPGLNYGDLEGDRRVVQDVCDALGAALFISTYYSHPLDHAVRGCWCTT